MQVACLRRNIIHHHHMHHIHHWYHTLLQPLGWPSTLVCALLPIGALWATTHIPSNIAYIITMVSSITTIHMARSYHHSHTHAHIYPNHHSLAMPTPTTQVTMAIGSARNTTTHTTLNTISTHANTIGAHQHYQSPPLLHHYMVCTISTLGQANWSTPTTVLTTSSLQPWSGNFSQLMTIQWSWRTRKVCQPKRLPASLCQCTWAQRLVRWCPLWRYINALNSVMRYCRRLPLSWSYSRMSSMRLVPRLQQPLTPTMIKVGHALA